KIITESQDVILISASYEQRVVNLRSLQSVRKELENKIRIIPNGVDDYWIANAAAKESKIGVNKVVDILFVGKFTKGKGIVALQKAVVLLNRANIKLKVILHIVGGGGSETNQVLKQIKRYPSLFRYHG